MTLLDHLRTHLIDVALVRAPDVAGRGARPWLPPCWRHPDDGAVGPGDADDEGKPETTHDDGLVISLMWAMGLPSAAGAEERRIDAVDVVMRSEAMPAIATFDAAVRRELLGTDPGGRCDWTMAGLYVVQSRQWRPFQPHPAEDGIYTFSAQYTFETRAA